MNTIETVMIPVSDQQKAKEFYIKLGFQIMVEAPMENGESWIQLGLPGQSTSISLMKFQGIICETDDIEKEISELRAKGIEPGKIDQTPWGKFCWVKDPDGNGISLHQK
jgi:catechol 2,3-dioxygenase-like lactoylglutathione lyase family enzyme